jgi:hypothetical protein
MVFYCIGGSLVSGVGVSTNLRAVSLASAATDHNLELFSEPLMKASRIAEVLQTIRISQEIAPHDFLLVSVGIGDTWPQLDVRIKRFLPRKWSPPGHMDPPLHLSSRSARRSRQKVVFFVKLTVKKFAWKVGLYSPPVNLIDFLHNVSEILDWIERNPALKSVWLVPHVPPRNVVVNERLVLAESMQKMVEIIQKRNLVNLDLLFLRDIVDENLGFLNDKIHLSLIGHEALGNSLISIILEGKTDAKN